MIPFISLADYIEDFSSWVFSVSHFPPQITSPFCLFDFLADSAPIPRQTTLPQIHVFLNLKFLSKVDLSAFFVIAHY